MIIIVEGIDRVGKSTLCNMLVDNGYKLINNKCKNYQHTVLRHELENERIKAQLSILEALPEDVSLVLDRFHFSQYVYGIVNRNLTDLDMLEIDERLSKLNAVLIFVNPTDISRSSIEHGGDLTEHQKLFDFCKSVTLMRYLETDYNNLQDVIRRLNDNSCK